MANEATRVEGPYEEHDFTVPNNLALSGGTLMRLSGARTAVITQAGVANQIFAGICSSDKEVNDGVTNKGLDQKGDYNLVNGGAATIAAGDFVTLSGANTISGAGNVFNAYTAGRALQSIAVGASGEVKITGLWA